MNQSPPNLPSLVKKLGLSAVVIGGFGIYAVSQHNQAPAPALPVSSQGTVSTTTGSPSTTPTTPTASTPPSTTSQSAGAFKDGSYTGNSADAYYGTVQVKATVSGGKLTEVDFLQYPHDRGNTIAINQAATPILAQEAIRAQSAQVDTVSGATDTSQAFVQSLSSALSRAE